MKAEPPRWQTGRERSDLYIKDLYALLFEVEGSRPRERGARREGMNGIRGRRLWPAGTRALQW